MDPASDSDDDGLGPGPADKDLVVIVYVHGQVRLGGSSVLAKHANYGLAARDLISFKGTDVTFEQFPDRIKHLVQTTLPRVKVRSEVFPVYETKGDLVSPRSRRLEFRC
jgi:hypothetical protein